MIDIIQDLIPKGRVNRPGTKITIKNIIIHETGNTDRGANAKAHASYIKNIKDQTSWHYSVDDKSIYQHIPDNEKSYSTGSRAYNESSIAIELCINADGDFEKTKKNGAALVKKLMDKYGVPISRVIRHKDCDGKGCPARLIKSGWDEFLKLCEPEKEKKLITIDELRKMGYDGVEF